MIFLVCDDYIPPLTVDCLSDIWLIVAECTAEGTLYPPKLNNFECEQLFGSMTSR